MRRLFFLFIYILTFIQISAKNEDSTDVINNIYFESLKDKLTIYIYGISKFNDFQLKNTDRNDIIKYSPNSNLNLGLGFNYRWVGIGAAFNFKFINNDNEIYGETSSMDLQLDLYSRRVLFTGSMQYYKGFYWKNVDEYYSDWSIEDSVIIRPDISTFTFSTSAIYTFNNDKFSFKAAFANNEWQKKSAGSWLAGSYFSLYGVNADSTLVPDIAMSSYPLYDSLAALYSYSIGGSFGYAYSLVIKEHFFISAALMLGISVQTYKAQDINATILDSGVKLSTKSHFRFAIGFNSERMYYGISAVADSYLTKNEKQSELSYNFGKIRIFYGYRFNVGDK
ncbi:MAG: DUF4421 domain-containing protein [Bacteroidales bacterium]|nr:DUF4421 domain-containing protein [Bacteroidales bacterium]